MMAAKVEDKAAAEDGRRFRSLMRNAADGPARDWLGGLAGSLTAAALNALPPAERLEITGGKGFGIELLGSASVRAALITLAEALPMHAERRRVS